MKQWKLNMVIVCSAAAALLLGGCQRCHYAGGPATLLPVENVSTSQVEILWADAHQSDGRLILHGTLQRRHTDTHPLRAHVDVEVQTPDGTRRLQTAEVWLPRRRPGKGPHFARFELELEDNQTAPTAIRLRPHTGSHAEGQAI